MIIKEGFNGLTSFGNTANANAYSCACGGNAEKPAGN